MSGRRQPSICARAVRPPEAHALGPPCRRHSASSSAGCCAGETGPSRRTGDDRRPRACARPGATACAWCAPESGAGSTIAPRRHRVGQAGAAAPVAAAPGPAAGGPGPRLRAVARPRSSPLPAPRAGCCARPPPPPPGGPTRCWRCPDAGTSSESSRLRLDSYDVATVTEVERHYAALGKPAVAAVLAETDERCSCGPGWVPESHDADTSSSWRRWRRTPAAEVRRPLRRAVDRRGGRRPGRGPASGAGQGHRGVRRRLGGLPRHRGRARAPAPGLAAVMAALLELGGRARRDHGVPPGARAQRRRRWRCTTAWASATHHAYALPDAAEPVRIGGPSGLRTISRRR